MKYLVIATLISAMLFGGSIAEAKTSVNDILDTIGVIVDNSKKIGSDSKSTGSNADRVSANYGVQVFYDDFNGTFDKTKWQVVSGEWGVDNGCLMPLDLREQAQARIDLTKVDIAEGYTIVADVRVPDDGCYDSLYFYFFSKSNPKEPYAFVIYGNGIFSSGAYWTRWKSGSSSSPIGKIKLSDNGVYKIVIHISKDSSSFSVDGSSPVSFSYGLTSGSLGINVFAKDDRNNSSSIRLERFAVYKPKTSSSTVENEETSGQEQAGNDPIPPDISLSAEEARMLASDLRKNMSIPQDQMKTSKTGVATFDLIGSSNADIARQFAECLYTAMFKEGFRLIDRGQLDKIIKELKLQQSGLTDPETIKKIGKIANCDYILVGSISASSDKTLVNSRLASTETGEIVSVGEVENAAAPKGKK